MEEEEEEEKWERAKDTEEEEEREDEQGSNKKKEWDIFVDAPNLMKGKYKRRFKSLASSWILQ